MLLNKDQLIPPDTERLTFRKLTKSDAELWVDFIMSDKAMEFFTLPQNRAESVNWINRQLKRYEDRQGGMLGVLNKSNGQMLGQCGLLIQEIEEETVLEVGYSFLPTYWGKGYATEAAAAFYEHGFKLNLSEFIVSVIHEENIASQRVAENNGLSTWKTTVWKGMPVQVWRIRNSEA